MFRDVLKKRFNIPRIFIGMSRIFVHLQRNVQEIAADRAKNRSIRV